MPQTPTRPRHTLIAMLVLWVAFYASFTLFAPPLLDDADSVHAEVAREMLLRHDYVTLYANGIRYLEKAPLLYWSMAASMRTAQIFGAHTMRAMAAACRFPIALTVFFLAWFTEAFARRMFRSASAGLYAALITLSSFGIFLFSRITLPDTDVCLWLTLALYAFWSTEEGSNLATHYQGERSEGAGLQARQNPSLERGASAPEGANTRVAAAIFGLACALNILSKGLIGLVFPIAIVAIYLLLTRGWRGAAQRIHRLHPWLALAVFLVIAAPWHILAGFANPTQGYPAPFVFAHGHWQVPQPTDGNVRGWFWFYFVNEHLLRYLNLRIPRDYDTVPLWLFWGLCFIWMFPWSAFLVHAVAEPVRQWIAAIRVRLTTPPHLLGLHAPKPDRGQTILVIWLLTPLLFFSLSTRQEYYVLPVLPAMAILIAGALHRADISALENKYALRITTVLVILGGLFAAAATYFLLHTKAPAPDTDLAQLLAQNPGDYALSMGHFLDLNAQALGLFRLPLILAAIGLFVGPLAALLMRRRSRAFNANLALAAGAFLFLLAAHLGLQTFAPVLSSEPLAAKIAPQLHPQDLIVLHGEYEAGSTLGFYLQRNDLHILEGRSSNLWYGSFFPDAPPIFETSASLAQKWNGPQRIFLWQSLTLTDDPMTLPPLPGPVYLVAKGGGKEILSNQPNH